MNPPDHPDFTALALGEHIHGTPARAVIEALRTSVSARQEAGQIRDTAARLSLVLKGQPPERLDNRRRNEIYHADVDALRARFAAEERAEELEIEFTPAPPVKRRRPGWVTPALAAAAVVTVAVTVLKLLPGGVSGGSANSPLTASTGDSDPAGRIMVTPAAEEKFLPRVPGPQAPPVTLINPVVPPQETPAAPAAEIPAAVAEVTPSPGVEEEEKTPEVIEPVPAKPPWRPNPNDYAAPPRRK